MTRSLTGALAAFCALAGAASAQTRAGGEFLVNSYTTGTQDYSSIGRDARGNFVVVWRGLSGAEARGQRFDRAGGRVGAEFAVNSSTGVIEYPSVAMGPRGDFLVAWAYAPDLVTPRDIMAQAFAASGARVGAEFRVNEFTTNVQTAPTAAADGRGNFVVVWWSQGQDGSGYAFPGRRVSRQGVPIGSEFVSNTTTAGNQFFGDVAAGLNGDFVVAWTDNDGNALGATAQRFDAAGTRVGGEFRVNTVTTGTQAAPGVAVAPDGSFVIAFVSTQSTVADVYAQRFTASGARIGAEFLVNTYTTGLQGYPHLSMDSASNFVVAWNDRGADGGYGVSARRFRADGTPRGGDFLVNTYTTGIQILSKGAAIVASDSAGNFAVTWYSEPHEPAGSIDPYAQRYGGIHPQALSMDHLGNAVWEPGETVPMRPTWFNANGAAQTVSGGLANLTGPAGPTYTITDATAVYGTIADNAAQTCTDCFAVSVSAPATRPATHWDAAAIETLTPDTQGQAKKWALHVGASFTDVPTTNAFYRFIETVLHHGITAGCTATTYCPDDPTARDQMTVFVLLGKEGAGYTPQACGTPVFSDVPAANPFCRFIEELARRGVVAGCGGGRYCPADPVTREQMSVFLLRTLDPTLNPPACTTPMFADVPATSAFCRWIEEMARRGITSGCGGGNFCPTLPVTRAQMAVFLATTFGLTLYGP